MRVGRNDPCPCGSGKKYKKCCLQTDRAKSIVDAQVTSPAASMPHAALAPAARLPAPEVEDFDGFDELDPLDVVWTAFQDSDLEGQIGQVLRMLESPTDLDHELVYDMMHEIYNRSLKEGQRNRYHDLLILLRQKAPEVYQSSAPFYLWQFIPNAIALGRLHEYSTLVQDFAEVAENNLDVFSHLRDHLEYHGLLAPLLESVRLAWDKVKEEDVLDWAIHEFAVKAIDYETFSQLEQTRDFHPDDIEFIARCERYVEELGRELFKTYLLHLTGRADRAWNISDFVPRHKRRKGQGRWAEANAGTSDASLNIRFLLHEFLGEIHRLHGVSYTRGHLAVSSLRAYLLERQKSIRVKGSAKKPAEISPHPLCPGRKTLDEHLGELLQFLNSRYVQVAAVMEVLPSWIGFLRAKELVTEDKKIEAMQELQPLYEDVLKLFKQLKEDPSLAHNVEAAWQPFLQIPPHGKR